ncbi:uncharacterized protein LOC117173449 [Belonocnema kinseyi]|uniref:uncharacterized protein LOC117173449 n=1 Tax=Belonocnema kinseyi TaxID=2817044 RepID=UPI00143DD9FC|nr:uncharacterized protein LOC117173449 [Belonocnema kinseyi]
MRIGALLLTLAIFYSFIGLSSQYNKDLLVNGTMALLDNLGIFFRITNNLDILVSDGHNKDIYGLIHDKYHLLVCALEPYDGQVWVRALMADGKQVKVDASTTYAWNKGDTDIYHLEFDKILS